MKGWNDDLLLKNQISVHLADKDYEKLKKYCNENNTTMSFVFRDLLHIFLWE